MYKKNLPSLDVLNKLFQYERETGKLYWKIRTPDMFENRKRNPDWLCKIWNSNFAGKEANNPHDFGYVYVSFNGKKYFAHKIIMYFEHGIDTEDEIDHINGNKSDNRLCNLRFATKSQNSMNTSNRKNNKSGVKGVHFNTHHKIWDCRIMVNKKVIHLGYYKNFNDAVQARKSAENKYFGDFKKET
jgi:hypothetical protein